jgi:AraC-like DNA-binding protein
MSIVFRAEDEPPASRHDYWMDVVHRAFGPAIVRPPAEPTAPERLVVGDLGAVRVAEMSVAWTTPSARCEALRTPRIIRRADPEAYRVDVVLRGQMVVEQDGRRSRLGPGDLSLVDLSRPAYWATSSEHALAMNFPRALLPLRQQEVARLTGLRVPGERGSGALVSSFARQVVGQLDDLGAADGSRLGTAMVDMLTVALASRLDRERQVPPDSVQRAMLLRVHAFIEERLGDPGLSPGTVASAHHISERYLYKLFATEGLGVADWIRRRRLERCRRDLLDPALRTRPVAAIAARWGITNAAHFSRLFRAAYGLPPGEYRTLGRFDPS